MVIALAGFLGTSIIVLRKNERKLTEMTNMIRLTLPRTSAGLSNQLSVDDCSRYTHLSKRLLSRCSAIESMEWKLRTWEASELMEEISILHKKVLKEGSRLSVSPSISDP